jgi:hypothetical protein
LGGTASIDDGSWNGKGKRSKRIREEEVKKASMWKFEDLNLVVGFEGETRTGYESSRLSIQVKFSSHQPTLPSFPQTSIKLCLVGEK